jgi:hypothetical protein
MFQHKPTGVRIAARVAIELVAFIFILKVRGFGAMRHWVAACPIARTRAADEVMPVSIGMVDRACLYSPWSMRCLARAAIATRVLRSLGFAATMVTGVQRLPFGAHAWVEVDGVPKYGMKDTQAGFAYLEIDRV